jgi:response regulator RpfG family c-di-GMP phosphodiesterase
MPRPRILLVDDDRRVRQLVGLTLPADDYELSFAEEGTDAIRVAQQTHPDLILLDYAMPGLHGVDVCAAIRSDSGLAGTPIIMLTGHGDDDTRQRSIRAGANGFLTKPFSPIALEQTIRSLLGAGSLPPLSPSEIRVAVSTAEPRPVVADAPIPAPPVTPAPPPAVRHGEGDDARRRYAGLHETFVTTIEALATALELRAAEVEGHAQRVSLYALAAARRLGLAGDALEQLRWGAILHDVGMIGVPDSILMKPGQLRPEEWALVRAHPESGACLLEHVDGLGSALEVVRFHHERFDGAGYPLGLRGTAIPLGARIFAVADALDAITTDRPYRPARTWEDARVEILQGRGSHFDPSIVDAFLEVFDDLQGLSGAERPFAQP